MSSVANFSFLLPLFFCLPTRIQFFSNFNKEMFDFFKGQGKTEINKGKF